MMDHYGTVNMLCLCICAFVYETLGNISFDIFEPRALENIWFVWSRTYHKGEKLRCHACDGLTDGPTHTGKKSSNLRENPQLAK